MCKSSSYGYKLKYYSVVEMIVYSVTAKTAYYK